MASALLICSADRRRNQISCGLWSPATQEGAKCLAPPLRPRGMHCTVRPTVLGGIKSMPIHKWSMRRAVSIGISQRFHYTTIISANRGMSNASSSNSGAEPELPLKCFQLNAAKDFLVLVFGLAPSRCECAPSWVHSWASKLVSRKRRFQLGMLLMKSVYLGLTEHYLS